jgi:energy-coupling factor transporter ATP-binding protein EcfA2
MRIAISGTHRSGKSTLVEELAGALPEYSAVEEPYYQLAEEGQDFAEMPSVEDFELQLERSIACLEEDEENVIFDRCPADLLGYLLTHSEAEAFDLKRWLPRIRKAMATLDLVVFLPIEGRDRIVLLPSEDPELRMLVDEKLREILLDNPFDFNIGVLEVTGSPRERARRVLMALSGPGSRV